MFSFCAFCKICMVYISIEVLLWCFVLIFRWLVDCLCWLSWRPPKFRMVYRWSLLFFIWLWSQLDYVWVCKYPSRINKRQTYDVLFIPVEIVVYLYLCFCLCILDEYHILPLFNYSRPIKKSEKSIHARPIPVFAPKRAPGDASSFARAVNPSHACLGFCSSAIWCSRPSPYIPVCSYLCAQRIRGE